MSNLSYYIWLALFGVGIFSYTVYKKKQFTDLFLFFLAASVFSWIGEYFVLYLFDAYIYKPSVFTDPFAESTLGHLITNTFFWGSTAVLVGAFSLRYHWFFLISAVYMSFDILFIKVGAYEHHWWRTNMTGITVIIFLIIIKKWFLKLKEHRYEFLRNITLLLVAFFFIAIDTYILLLLGKQHYRVDWYENMYRDSTVFSFLYHAGIALVFIFFVCILKKWYWKISPILFFLLSDSLLLNMKILIFQDGWSFFYLTLTRILALAIFVLLEKNTLKQEFQN
ncbi:hypothetical protein EHS13_23485 [Paenibacillus psychroresistens]|uniref:Uncharacterized protein n=1 Tax=Paenibacillus psychroresistens TaxID=1778678 RepID=A0A6B8RNN9_9BACL|nr:hypothetical protein [Paenibacillus psychroresistens]QGQ97639.1 hypothetical protein EHS13_23485 [Paenibacillus psychroresistens]